MKIKERKGFSEKGRYHETKRKECQSSKYRMLIEKLPLVLKICWSSVKLPQRFLNVGM